ncbi:MAG TPA: protease modulator HflC [Sphingomonadaceae bacterium]|nr:protease modulator HflC [Sphingomonadaceae bacterium]
MGNFKAIIAIVAVAIVGLFASMAIVPETQQAVIIQAGEPVRTANKFDPDTPFGETGAGIIFHVPFYEQVQLIDRRIMDLDMTQQEVLTSDQQRLLVDAYARFRIIDPVRMVENAGSEENVATQLAPILSSVVRQELGRRSFASLLTAERGNAMVNIRGQLDNRARQYGAQVLDVRIKRADLPDGAPLDAAFARMRSDREAEAETIRAQGRRDARIIQAEAQAEASRIYAEAYGKDPQFYDFYRAMQSYVATFDSNESERSIILSPDNDYLRQFQGGR